ncbi:glucosaminidase domain-containing protein [Crocinitomicaceae bacterium CZZ-1]|uniref:Peptidoglycan hydrolase n=1 Tax=Taishania pollutisoli TaxID=2766479 RepID=A0A8J6PKH3_9FLAO|nr:glucosaminidase domain-containing protein [Taishania pollutisoli]MBC9813244.1 glucosaminidase domain-containing protein [Taishania pollutisoli]MBX2948985.1 glucosaminidase domain-containing protein [Crocinitomicaceae bacterium]NGF76970.1 LysM peptidoglycan-binding domain-containing protein [Fluviicola sp. SGL-29]
MKKVILLTGVLLAFHAQASNQNKITKQEYINTWSPVAMENMLSHKIPASITLAQGILESGSGNSELAREANNHFGIKCHNWTGEKVYRDDDAKNECFRKYSNAELSFVDHSEFLTGRQRYAELFTLKADDYKAWAKGLKAAGYATNPKYPDLLIDLIESMELYKFDELVLNSPGKATNVLAKKEKSQPEYGADKKVTTVSAKKTTSKQPQKKQEIEVTLGKTRETALHDNKVKFVIAKKGDTYYKIAEEFGMTLNQIHKYNDVKNGNTSLKAGDIVNIHPKRSKGKEDTKTYSKEMTILEISQLEGIKVESLMKLNHLSSSQETVKKGQKVALR